MPRSRILMILVGTFLLFALLASGCSSGDDEGQAAAVQPAGAGDQLGFTLDSANFQQKVQPYVRIPKKNSCHRDNLSPPLDWAGAPEAAVSFALIAQDLDHATGGWVHWVLYNIPADATGLPEGVPTTTLTLTDGTLQGTNDDRLPGYHGPCPPVTIIGVWTTAGGSATVASRSHEFTLYALDSQLGLAPGATREELLKSMEGHILAEAKTLGKFVPPVIRSSQEVTAITAVASTTPVPSAR